MEYFYSIVLTAAGVYALLIGHNLLPPKEKEHNKENETGRHKNWMQYTVAGIILIYFGVSNMYSIFMQ